MISSEKRYLLLICFSVLFSALSAQNVIEPKSREKVEINVPREKFHLYLLIGQSNMAGRGTVEPCDTIGFPRILRLNRHGDWEIAKDPLHFDKAGSGTGPGLSFAREMLSCEEDDVVIGLIPCAAGGSSIDVWKTGVFWHQTQTFPYNDALIRTKLAMKDGTLKGILWHQGESDTAQEKTAVYGEKLVSLIISLRQEFKLPSVPFVAGELSGFSDSHDEFNKMLHKAEKNIPYFSVVSSKGFTAMPDGVHLDSSSQREFGKRYAQKVIALKIQNLN